MARKFRKKAGLGIVCLPGLPGLGNDTVVEGDEYARFCPAILEEVFGDTSAKPVAKKAPVAKPAPAPEPEPEPDPEPEEEPEPESNDAGEPPNMDWLKSELVEYGEGLGLDVDGMTKREILKAIEDEEG